MWRMKKLAVLACSLALLAAPIAFGFIPHDTLHRPSADILPTRPAIVNRLTSAGGTAGGVKPLGIGLQMCSSRSSSDHETQIKGS